MPAIKEKDLPIAGSIANGDYLRTVDSYGTSKKMDVAILAAFLESRGKYLKGAWTATASSSTGTQLTAAITLTKGLWIVTFTVPPYTATNRMPQVYLEGNDYRVSNANYLQGFWIVEVTTTKTVSIKAGAGTSVTWDSGYLDRGGIFAIRMAEVYD